jgi:hypothetical protein
LKKEGHHRFYVARFVVFLNDEFGRTPKINARGKRDRFPAL